MMKKKKKQEKNKQLQNKIGFGSPGQNSEPN